MTTPPVQRKLTAILCADVAGYSRLMGNDPEGTLETLIEFREVFSIRIEAFHGRVVNAPGDAILADFGSVVDAVVCAVEIQKELAQRNEDTPGQDRMDFRIGVNLGDVLVKDGDIFGDGVNVTARLETLAEPGGICISGDVYNQVKKRLGLQFEFMGEKSVKNIAEPVKAYRVLTESTHFAVGKNIPGQPATLAPPTGKPSIAILNFENMSSDPEQEFFGDGLAEDIITDLSRISGLFVIARNSSFSYKGRNVPVQQIGREMGVRYVMEGSVRKSGDRVRITAQLIEAETGRHLWAKRFDRDLKDVFEVQDEITEEVVTTLEVKLAIGEQARIWRKSLKNPDAREIYYRARDYFQNLSLESVKQARELFAQVIEAEPDSPLGYAYLAGTHWYDAFRGWSTSPDQSLKTSEELVRKALALDETNAEAHVYLAAIYILKGEFDQALAEGERAVALGPNISDAFIHMGVIYYFLGRFDEALEMINRGMRICPVCPGSYMAVLGQILNLLERYDEAILAYQKAATLEPDYPTPHFGLAVVYGALGRKEAAIHAAEAFHRASPNRSSLQEYARRHPFKDPAYNQRWIEALNKVGIE